MAFTVFEFLAGYFDRSILTSCHEVDADLDALLSSHICLRTCDRLVVTATMARVDDDTMGDVSMDQNLEDSEADNPITS